MNLPSMLASSPLDPLYMALGSLLSFFYAIVPSFGFAIIMLTITVRVALIPLTAKQLKSQQAMQRLQPELKKLQVKYKGDRQKLNEEMMKLYKEHKANPLAGCLPLLLQMPLFIVLYRLILDLSKVPPNHIPIDSSLYNAIVASDGKLVSFAMDLAVKPGSVPGGFFNAIPYFILVGLVVATGYFQQRQMSSRMPKGDGINNQMQAVMKVFPLFFGVISLSVPAGVVLYFFVSNLWQIGQQAVAFRNMPVPEPTGGAGKPGAARGAKRGGTGTNSGGRGLGGRLQQAKAWLTGPEEPAGGAKGAGTKGLPAKGGAGGKGGQAKGGQAKGGQVKGGQVKGGGGGAKGGPSPKGITPAKGRPTPKAGSASKGSAPAKGRGSGKGGQPAKTGGTSNGGRPAKTDGAGKGVSPAKDGGTTNGKGGAATGSVSSGSKGGGTNASGSASAGTDGSGPTGTGGGSAGKKSPQGKSTGKGGAARYRRAPKATRPPPAPRPKGLPPTTGSSGG